MNVDLVGTTSVAVRLTERRATIADVRDALDTLIAEGIPETFEISIMQEQGREHEEGVPYADRKVTHSFHVQAERAARSSS